MFFLAINMINYWGDLTDVWTARPVCYNKEDVKKQHEEEAE